MRILITGASGLVGLNLALEAARAGPPKENQGAGSDESRVGEAAGGWEIFGVTYQHPLETSAFQVVQADLLAPGEIERVLDQTQPNWVINCAALAVVDACEADPDLAYRMNAVLPAKLAAYVARGGARLVHLSTDAVFDGQRGNYSEDDTPNPLSVYARTKLDGEQATLEANPDVLIARINLFGWSLSGRRSLAEWFFYNLQAGRQVMGFTDVYFCPLLVNDLAHILLGMLNKGLSGLYHAVSSQCLSKYDFGAALARQFDLDPGLIQPAGVSEAGLKAARSPNLTLRTDKLARDLGQQLPGVPEALQRFHELYRQGYPEYLKGLDSADLRGG